MRRQVVLANSWRYSFDKSPGAVRFHRIIVSRAIPETRRARSRRGRALAPAGGKLQSRAKGVARGAARGPRVMRPLLVGSVLRNPRPPSSLAYNARRSARAPPLPLFSSFAFFLFQFSPSKPPPTYLSLFVLLTTVRQSAAHFENARVISLFLSLSFRPLERGDNLVCACRADPR